MLKRREFVKWVSGEVSGFGPKNAESLHAGLSADIGTIDTLLGDGHVIIDGGRKTEGPERSLTFVVTGNLSRWERSAVKDALADAGHKLVGSVSKKTDYVVTNDKTSGTVKLKEAARLGIPVIDEDEFERVSGIGTGKGE